MANSWASVREGKWHRTLSDSPTFLRDETSECGITFQPLNVTWDQRPYASERYICKKCDK